MTKTTAYFQKNKLAIDEFRNLQIDSPIMGQFIEQAGRIFITLAKAKINVKTGNLRNSIGFIERDNRGKGRAFRLIGARVYGPFKGFHAHLIEEGTADRTPSRKKKTSASGAKYGKNIGPAKPFMRPAFESGKNLYIQAMNKLVTTHLADKAKRAGLQTK
jgi:hypothetical protein